MTGRIPFGLLTLLTALAAWPVQAQNPMGAPPGYGVQQAGFQTHQDSAGQYRAMPRNYGYDPGLLPGTPPPMTYENLPDKILALDEDTPLERLLTNTFRHGWFRAEYLLWNISSPGGNPLTAQVEGGAPIDNSTTGAPPTSDLTVGVPFTRLVNTLGSGTLTTANGFSQVPTLTNFDNRNMNGFRGTFGLPTQIGTVELGGFVLAAMSTEYEASIFIPGSAIKPQIIANPATTVGVPIGANGFPAVNGQTATFISQAMLINGFEQPGSSSSSNIYDYDISYRAKLTASAWGSEGILVLDSVDPNSIFQLRPSFGLRYLSFSDRMDQSGEYTDATQATPIIVNRSINAAAYNNVVGPQIGLRTELVSPFVVVGFEPKMLFGINSWAATLDTSNILSSTDPAQHLSTTGTTFSPMVDLKAYANVALSKYCSAYVAYNFIWAGQLNRSYNTIVYNKSTVTNTSDFRQQDGYSTATLQGLSFGFQFTY